VIVLTIIAEILQKITDIFWMVHAEIVRRVCRDVADILIFGQSLQRHCIEAAADRDHGCLTVLGCLQFE
jgi:hypothetical protein